MKDWGVTLIWVNDVPGGPHFFAAPSPITTRSQRRLSVTADCPLTTCELIRDAAARRSPVCHPRVNVIKEQQVRRCRNKWISIAPLVTGAGHRARL